MRIWIFVAGIAVVTGVALGGDTFVWAGTNNATWKNLANWETTGGDPAPRYPQAGDRAKIVTGAVDVKGGDSMLCETVEIGDEGGILIKTDATLSLTNHNCGLVPSCTSFNSILDGTIELEDDGTLAFTTGNHTVIGDGFILAPIDNSELTVGGRITIASGKFFQNGKGIAQTTIRGSLTISGAGRFINDGIVEAVQFDPDGSGVDFLVIDTAILDDTADATWFTNCQAMMVFKVGACLEGDFDDVGITNGTGGAFVFEDVTVDTTGIYIRIGCGPLILIDDAQFAFSAQSSDDCDVDTDTVESVCAAEDLESGDAVGGSIACVGGP